MVMKGQPIRFSFRAKLIVFFSGIIILAILTIGLFSYIEASNIIEKDINMFTRRVLKEVNLNLERYLKQYEQIFFNFATSTEFEVWLASNEEEKLNNTLNALTIFDNYLKPVTAIYPEILTINMLCQKGKEETFYINQSVFFNDEYSLADEDWFKNMELSNKTHVVTRKNLYYRKIDSVYENFYTMHFIRKFSYTPQANGFVQIDVSLEPITEILTEMKYSDDGEGMILDENGLILAHTDHTKISSQYNPAIFNQHIKGKDSGYLFDKASNRVIVFSAVKRMGWTSVSVIPYDSVAEGVNQIWKTALVIVIMSICLSIILIVLTSSTLTRRINALSTVINQTRIGNTALRVQIKGNDEIKELSIAYNSMLEHMENYISELAETRLLQQEAVLRALQAQINSHFIYNTLEIVNSMAYIAKQSDISKVVLSLSKMLRYTSNYKECIVTIKDELDHLNDYLRIMQYQMGQKLSFSIDADPEIGEELCLKAIFQPIVENSIIHGFETNGGKLKINIHVMYQGTDHLCISIEDNGAGFSQQKLEELSKQFERVGKGDRLSEISRVGLLNVHYRLKVYYNNDAETGVRIGNAANNKGAFVKIVLPLQLKGVI